MDNRLLLDPTGQNHGLARALYWNLQFYTPPIELEVVEGHDALGFNIDPLQQTITVLQPWDKQFRSMSALGPSSVPFLAYLHASA